jgi:pimeloyl-ACP methyl ester carboxylesterase
LRRRARRDGAAVIGRTLFLHPVGLDGDCFQFLGGECLAGAIRYDCVWHGDRPRPSGPLTIETMARDVLANTSEPLDVVGVSMGGQVAQRMAMLAPDRVRSLFITSAVNPRAPEPGLPDPAIGSERARLMRRLSVAERVEWALERWFTPKALAAPGHAGVRYTRERIAADTAEQLAAGWNALAGRRPSRTEQARALTMPTTCCTPCRTTPRSVPAARSSSSFPPRVWRCAPGRTWCSSSSRRRSRRRCSRISIGATRLGEAAERLNGPEDRIRYKTVGGVEAKSVPQGAPSRVR